MRAGLFFILLIVFFVFAACEQVEEPEVIEFSLSDYAVNAPPEGGSYQIQINTNVATWQAVVDFDNYWWCSVSANLFTNMLYIDIARTESETPRQTRVIVQVNNSSGALAGSDTIFIRQAGWNVPPEGVLINSTIWARYNVDSFGTFAESPFHTGQLYQFNDKTGYTAAASNGSLNPAWSPAPFVNEWQSENNPCPAGWRLPTQEEMFALIRSGYQYNAMLNGFFFGRNSQSATKENSQVTVFLPAGGFIENGGVVDMFQAGRYWVQNGSMQNNDGSITYRFLQFHNDGSENGLAEFIPVVVHNIHYAFSVRCVHP